MTGIARKTDKTMGVCSHPDHDPSITIGGSITTGSSTVTVNGLEIARVGDTVTADCGHTSVIITGSASITSLGLDMNIARLGDSVGDGPYIATITTASTTVSTV